MKYNQLIEYLQNLTFEDVTQTEIGKALDVSRAAINNRKAKDLHFSKNEIQKIVHYLNKVRKNEPDNVFIDFYPDVFASCGGGTFVLSENKTKILIPKADILDFSPTKTYSIICAKGDSMQPLINDNDKLIIEHYTSGQITDNRVYVFRLGDNIYIKRLCDNIDQIIIKSDNDAYPMRIISKDKADLQIIGKIIGLARDLR